MQELPSHIRDHELWLMEQILHYAKEQGYTEYTSTLVEAWRVSIQGLSDAIVDTYEQAGDTLPQFSPHDKFEANPIAQFGITEARLHRQRGISLQMFLGLYKYYRYSFIDLIRLMDDTPERICYLSKFVERIFDLIEIAFCSEWVGLRSDNTILELQQSNRAITNEKNKYLTLFESLSMPAFLIGRDGVVNNLNLAAMETLGLPSHAGATYYASEQKGQGLPKGSALADLIPWISAELHQFLNGQLTSKSFEHAEKNAGEYKHYRACLARMKDISGKFDGGVVIIEDLTLQKQMEFELAQSRKLESIGQLAAGIAHEINTPLQFIGHNLQFIEESLGPLLPAIATQERNAEEKKSTSDSTQENDLDFVISEIPKAIKESQNGIKHVSTIVQALRTMAHPDHNIATHIDFCEIINNIIQITRSEWEHVAHIEMDYANDLYPIEGVRGDFNQITLNLIRNATQAVREKYKDSGELGTITISTRNKADGIEIVVEDDGCGISETIAHRIFDPFFTTKEVGEGTGQGLHVVHSLVKKNGGEVGFTSEEGRGARFYVRFPKVKT